MSALGYTRKNGYDKDGYERRERIAAICECPKCRKEVELWEQTTEWTKGRGGRWNHSHYDGCATGVCCGLLFADDWDGTRVFQLDK